MLNYLIIATALCLLGGLLHFEKKENRTGVLLTKTPLSALFIVASLVQPHTSATYFYPLLTGLILCMAGDIFLALPQKKMFLWGLVSFLLGHVGYLVAFFWASQVNLWSGIGVITTLVTGVLVFIWLRPHLGSMKLPVLMYVIVISLMLCGAWSILGDTGVPVAGRTLVFTGGLSFYLSDLFVARHRFIKQAYLNRLSGLPLYYFGQFLLAFSTGVIS